MIPKFINTEQDTKVWSRDSVGAEYLLLLVPWDARVTEYQADRQLTPEKRNLLKALFESGK